LAASAAATQADGLSRGEGLPACCLPSAQQWRGLTTCISRLPHGDWSFSKQTGLHKHNTVGNQVKASPLCRAQIQIIEHSNEAAVFCKIYHGPFKLQDKAETEREDVSARESNALQAIAQCLAAHCGRKQPKRFMADLETTTESSASSKLKS